MNEVFRSIPGYEEFYEVSNLGRVKSLRTNMIMSPAISTSGYYKVNVKVKGKQKMFYIHRLLGEIFLGKVEGKNYINHINSNKLDNSLENLEWVTQSENLLHAHNHLEGNLRPINGRRKNARLTVEQVLEMRSLYLEKKMSQRELASRYGIVQQTVSEIIRREKWKQI